MLRIDYANCLSTRVGEHGLDPGSLGHGSGSFERARAITASLHGTRGTGWEVWRELPFEPMRSRHVREVMTIADRYRGKIDNLVVLGIGGSALGNIALQSALNPATHNLIAGSGGAGKGGAGKGGWPRMFVVDNVDPANLGSVLEFVRSTDPGLKRTLFNVVSKSGETAETAAQFLAVRRMAIDAVGQAAHAERIVAITDPQRGTMREICNANGYATLPVPDGVGGRFSVLSPVGLFSAAMCGIDIDALLDGASAMDKRCSEADLLKNPAAMLATLLVRLGVEKGKTVHVMMPYANGLYLMADWFRQLWAESLGKRMSLDGQEVFTGFTPVKALGTTDQHSQVQLYREGPNDKVIVMLEVEDFGGRDMEIPEGLGHEKLSYLEGRSFGELLRAEKRATEYALVESQRPNCTISFPAVDERRIGQFIQLWQVATAYAGAMLNIDAYDQPAVETGKLATFGLMGREGYGEWESKVSAALAATDHIV
ncbi:MAG: glucose-6-phosphate isomerase [Phycisphaerales bacterium]